MHLSELRKGEEAIICGFEDEALGLKLQEMGCLPGELIVLEMIAPLGDPVSINIHGSKLSMRKSVANTIIVEKQLK